MQINFNPQIFAKIISGCGPYRLTSWESGSKIILEKEKLVGEKYASNQAMLQANPDKISYLIIPDEATAVLALKDGSVDICTDISPRQFEALRMDSSSKTKLQFLHRVYFNTIILISIPARIYFRI